MASIFAGSVCISRDMTAASLDQRPGLFGAAVPDRHIMAGLDEIAGYGASHPAQPDESDFHYFSPLGLQCGRTPGDRQPGQTLAPFNAALNLST
jgi:hypothetical protein